MPFVDFGDPLAFVVDVSCGSSFTCAVVALGGTRREIRCFGANDLGQLGRVTGSEQEQTDTTVASDQVILGARTPEQVSCSLTTACAVLSGGALTCWGTTISVQPELLLGRGQPLPEGRWASGTRSSLVEFGRRRPAIVQLPSVEASRGEECSDLKEDISFVRGNGWLIASPSAASTVAVIPGAGPCKPAVASLAFGTATAFQLDGWRLREGPSGGVQTLIGLGGLDIVSESYLGAFVGRQLIVPGTSELVSERTERCDFLDQQLYSSTFSDLLDSIQFLVEAMTDDGLVATAGGSRIRMSSPLLELLQHLRPGAVPGGVQLQVRSVPATDCVWKGLDGLICTGPPGYGESSPATACLPGLARRSGSSHGSLSRSNDSSVCAGAGYLAFRPP